MKPDKVCQVSKGMAVPYPLRPDFMCELILPTDMTVKEAERLCAMLMLWALPVEKP